MAAKFDQELRKELGGSGQERHLCEESSTSVLQSKRGNAEQSRVQLGCNNSSHGFPGAPKVAIGGIRFQPALTATFALRWRPVVAAGRGKVVTHGERRGLH